MGKKSAEALSIVPRTPGALIPEPADLSPEERALWREVVSSKPSEWFGMDSVPVLTDYVRAVTTCRILDQEVAKALPQGVSAAKLALELRDKESKRAGALATKLRLTQQSRYTPMAAATANKRANGQRPWQSERHD